MVFWNEENNFYLYPILINLKLNKVKHLVNGYSIHTALDSSSANSFDAEGIVLDGSVLSDTRPLKPWPELKLKLPVTPEPEESLI